MGNKFETIAVTACMTTLLMLFNLIFLCSGLVVLIGGVWMRIQLKDYIDMSSEGSGVVLLALASSGALVTLTSILACCCTARGHPALLYLYGGFLAVVALLELCTAASVYTYRTTMVDNFDQVLNQSITFYGEDDGSAKKHVDIMQSTLQCCGNRAYTDWLDTKPPKDIPESCCNVAKAACEVSETDDIYVDGCYKRVIEFINSNVGLVAGGTFGVAFFPLVGVFLSCCLANHINKTKYEQVA